MHESSLSNVHHPPFVPATNTLVTLTLLFEDEQHNLQSNALCIHQQL